MDKWKKLWPGLVLVALCGIILCSRLHTYNEPLERDITIYAVIAHEMRAGRALYSDLWDHKPPAIYVSFEAAELVAGYGRRSIFLVNILATLGTMIACYVAGSAEGAGRMGGLVAATLWAFVSGDIAFEGNQPNTEVFLNAFLTAGFAVFIRAQKENLGPLRALVAGLFFAIASLYKQVVIAEAALLALAYLVWTPTGARKKAIVDLALFGSVGAAAWAAVSGYFAARGHGQAFFDAVITYNRWYSSSSWHKDFDKLPFIITPDGLSIMVCIGSLFVMGLIFGFISGPRRPWVLLLAFAIATQIAVLSPGRFHQHYYQLLLPPLMIGAGWAVAMLRDILPARLTWLSYATIGVVIMVIALLEAPYYRVPAEMWSVKKYGGVFVATDNLAHGIDHLLLPNETFYEWGNESGLYFTTARRPPSGIIFAYPVQDGPLASRLIQRLQDDVERAQPELVVVNWEDMKKVGSALPLLKWCKQNYRPIYDTKIFLLLARKGGRLDRQQAMVAN